MGRNLKTSVSIRRLLQRKTIYPWRKDFELPSWLRASDAVGFSTEICGGAQTVIYLFVDNMYRQIVPERKGGRKVKNLTSQAPNSSS